MMGLLKKITIVVTALLITNAAAYAQGLHFSQYYNAPMLLNPANTALMSDDDFRVGANYREQWASLPVPYNTTSAFADFQAFRQEELANNWLGIGFAFFGDKAGDGMLTMQNMQMSLAYHIQLSEISMFSAGLYGAYIQRSVDYNKLTFDLQWDGEQFNTSFENGEKINVIKTNYIDAGAGINYAYFPNEAVYFKIGAGVSHVNAPNETFYGINNNISIRPMVNADGIFLFAGNFTLNPSVYFATQRAASEITFGSQFIWGLTDDEKRPAEIIIGGYHRWAEAFIGAVGVRYSSVKVMFSYDYTMSKLKPYNNGQGAVELALIYLGKYGKATRAYRSASCPRF